VLRRTLIRDTELRGWRLREGDSALILTPPRTATRRSSRIPSSSLRARPNSFVMQLAIQQIAKSSTHRSGAAVLTGLVLVVWLAFSLLPAAAVAQRRVEIYQARNRTAEELVSIAQAVMAESGGVEVDARTNSLVLIGDAGAVSEALTVLSSQDRALRTVLLRYDTRRIRELAAQGFQLRWTASTGELRLGDVRLASESGSEIRAKATGSMQRLVETFSGVLRVEEGAATRIETGTIVPYPTRGPAGTSTEFVNATTGFDAKPRILADGRVQVDLATFARELRPDLSIDSMGASTLVTLKPGALVAVGSTSRAGIESHAKTFEGERSERRGDETVLLLRVDLE
jgi:hypothetical protein